MLKKTTQNFIQWYSNPERAQKIAQYCDHREFAMIVPKWESEELKKRNTRNLRLYSKEGLQFWFNRYCAIEQDTPYNLYCSVAEYKGYFPNLKSAQNTKEENDELIKQFYTDYHKKIAYYPLLIDIDDRGDSDSTKEQVLLISALLKDNDVAHVIVFTGNGFHILAEQQSTEYDYSKEGNVYDKHKQIAQLLIGAGCEGVDINVYGARALMKIPYTIAHCKDGQYIVTPLTEEQVKTFNRQDYSIEQYQEKENIPDPTMVIARENAI